jgi:hypothetical protein
VLLRPEYRLLEILVLKSFMSAALPGLPVAGVAQ